MHFHSVVPVASAVVSIDKCTCSMLKKNIYVDMSGSSKMHKTRKTEPACRSSSKYEQNTYGWE